MKRQRLPCPVIRCGRKFENKCQDCCGPPHGCLGTQRPSSVLGFKAVLSSSPPAFSLNSCFSGRKGCCRKGYLQNSSIIIPKVSFRQFECLQRAVRTSVSWRSSTSVGTAIPLNSLEPSGKEFDECSGRG